MKCDKTNHTQNTEQNINILILSDENGMKKRVIREFIGNRMILFDDNGKKVYEEVWFGDTMNGFVIHPEMEGMKGFFKELNMNGELLSVSEYDDGLLKNGKCFEYEGGRLELDWRRKGIE